MPASHEERVLATATDSMQRVSNALYGSLGIVPRMPLLSLVGRPERGGALAELPQGVTAAPMNGSETFEVDTLDSEILGYTHRVDHDFVVGEGKQGFVYRSGDGELLGYGYTSAVGRVAPVAARDEALLWPIVSHLLTVIEPRGASAIWAPGAAAQTMRGLLRSGLRLEDYPILVCWSEPFADFSRYVPISPGLL
jgi:hypothetical protein